MIKKKICSAVLAMVQALSVGYAFAEETASVQEQTQQEEQYTAPENEVQVFVSPDGNDSNSGTYESPVKTINAGISKGLSAKSSSDGKTVSVNLRGGDYYISDTIKLSGNMSGTTSAPFVIRGYNGEKANIKMSKKLTPAKFSQLKDEEILKKIPSEARKYIGVYDMTGVLSSNDINNYNLIVNDNEQTVARWPNTGFDRISKVVNTTTFTGKSAGSRPSKWKDEKNAVIGGYFGVEYRFDRSYLNSTNSSEIVLETKPYYGMKNNDRYYIENLLQELDNPGEFYVDARNKKLYFYPPYNIADADIEISEANKDMMTGSKLSNITLQNLSFSGTQGNGIVLSECDNIVVDNCEVKHIAKNGIMITDSANSSVKNSTVSYIGETGVYMSGGDRDKLISGNNVIENNHIYEFGKKDRTGGLGVKLYGVGGLIQHNLIHNSTAAAINMFGNDHKILYNELYNVVNEPCDAGAIYTGRNYTYRGIEVAYNYIHDIDTTANKGGSIFVAGIYYDDLMSSAYTHHNILYKCNLGIMIGGGRDHIFENNIVADCENGLFFDARGIGWAAYHAAKGGQAYNTVLEVPYNKSPWKEKYPELASILDKPDELGRPMNNKVKDNILYKCMSNMVANEFKQYGVYENNLEDKTDGSYFEDLDNRNLNLKKDSNIAKEFPQIAEIDMSQIGLLKDKAESEKIKAQEQGLRLISPMNGQTGISNLSSTFTWDRNDGADKYIVKIAEDPEMQNVVIEQETNKNYADVKYIPSGRKPFWWTVTGINTSQSMSGSFEQTGAPRLIVSNLTEKTDRSALTANVELCQRLYNGVHEGIAAGTFKKGYKDKVKAALDAGIAANESSNVKQKEIEAANDGIEKVIGELSEYINYDTVNVGEMLKDQGGWSTVDGKYTFGDDGSLALTGSAGRTTHYEMCGYDSPLPACTAVKFGYKVNVSSNYCIIGLQNAVDAFLNGGYEIIVKSNQFEIQKHVEGTVGDPIKTSDLNFYISDNKWVDLEFGALQLDIGTYVFLKADGYLVTEFLDTEAPKWTGDSKFTFSNPSGVQADCYAAIRAAKE